MATPKKTETEDTKSTTPTRFQGYSPALTHILKEIFHVKDTGRPPKLLQVVEYEDHTQMSDFIQPHRNYWTRPSTTDGKTQLPLGPTMKMEHLRQYREHFHKTTGQMISDSDWLALTEPAFLIWIVTHGQNPEMTDYCFTVISDNSDTSLYEDCSEVVSSPPPEELEVEHELPRMTHCTITDTVQTAVTSADADERGAQPSFAASSNDFDHSCLPEATTPPPESTSILLDVDAVDHSHLVPPEKSKPGIVSDSKKAANTELSSVNKSILTLEGAATIVNPVAMHDADRETHHVTQHHPSVTTTTVSSHETMGSKYSDPPAHGTHTIASAHSSRPKKPWKRVQFDPGASPSHARRDNKPKLRIATRKMPHRNPWVKQPRSTNLLHPDAWPDLYGNRPPFPRCHRQSSHDTLETKRTFADVLVASTRTTLGSHYKPSSLNDVTDLRSASTPTQVPRSPPTPPKSPLESVPRGLRCPATIRPPPIKDKQLFKVDYMNLTSTSLSASKPAPRAPVASSQTKQAFIPSSSITALAPIPSRHTPVQAPVLSPTVHSDLVREATISKSGLLPTTTTLPHVSSDHQHGTKGSPSFENRISRFESSATQISNNRSASPNSIPISLGSQSIKPSLTQPKRVEVKSQASRPAQWYPIVSYRDSRHPFSTPSLKFTTVLPRGSIGPSMQDPVTENASKQDILKNESMQAQNHEPRAVTLPVWDVFVKMDSSRPIQQDLPVSVGISVINPDHAVFSVTDTHSEVNTHSDGSLEEDSNRVLSRALSPDQPQVREQAISDHEWGADLSVTYPLSPCTEVVSSTNPNVSTNIKCNEPQPWPHVYPHKIKDRTCIVTDQFF